MNWKAFFAMLARDAHVARRNFVALLFQTFLQPLMFVFIFGRVMVGSGYMPPSYKSLLLPGIMAICMVGTGIWAVAMPLIAEFQFTREIEDRLLAPMDISWLAIEKVVAGTLQALAAGLMVIPAAWLLLRPGVESERSSPAALRRRGSARSALFRHRRSGPRLQRRANSHRPDVQPRRRPDDFLRLHLLSLERPGQIPHPAKSRARESPRLRQRRPARHHGPPVPASSFVGRPGRTDFLQHVAAHHRPPQIPRKGRHLISSSHRSSEKVMKFAKDCISGCRHLGPAGPHAALLHVRSHQSQRSASHHSSRILLWICRSRSGVADRLYVHCDRSGTLSAADDSVRPRKSQLERSSNCPRIATTDAQVGPGLRRHGFVSWTSLRDRLLQDARSHESRCNESSFSVARYFANSRCSFCRFERLC